MEANIAGAKTLYTCHKLENIWHWCRNCPDYPKGNFVINRATPPPQPEQCPKCADLQRQKRCEDRP